MCSPRRPPPFPPQVWGLDERACGALPATKGHVALMLRQQSSMAESSMTDVDVL